MTRTARYIVIPLLLSFYILGLSGLAARGSSCCCEKSGALIHYCCVKTSASCCDGKTGISTCHATETAKEFTGPLAVIEPPVRIALLNRDADLAAFKDNTPIEGYTTPKDHPPRLIS